MKKLSINVVKILFFLLATIISLTACSKNEDVKSVENNYKIGITQIVDHSALNQVKEGFIKKSKDLGMNIEIDEQIAQGDIATSQMIADKFVSEEKDLILAISTPSAQSAKNATKENAIPIIFAAVSDPLSAGLVEDGKGLSNITGVTDRTTEENIIKILEISKEIKPQKNTIAVIYNVGESNSIAQVEELKKIAKQISIDVVEVGISSISDIDQAFEVISSQSEVLFLIADNMLASSMSLVSQKAIEKGIVTVSTVASFVDEGALLSIGIDYEKLGEQSAEIAKQILVDKIDISNIDIQSPVDLYTKLNEDAASKLNLDINNIKKLLNIDK